MQQLIPFSRTPGDAPRIALAHDYLIQDGGAERVLEALHACFPAAPIFTLFFDAERTRSGFQHADIRTSALQKWPLIRGREEWTLPFMPMAVEHLDLSGFDVVISSSSSFAKGIIAPPNAIHICYLHTPTRFLWEDRMSYVNDLPQPKFIKSLIPFVTHRLRIWDRLAAERPDILITNSETSRRRILRYYGRDALVIPPPVDLDRITRATTSGTFWLAGGRLVAYKRFDLIVKAFARLNMPLKIFGIGPEFPRLRAMAGPKTAFLGRVSDDEKIRLYEGAIGFINPQVEDFGITPIEAMSAGRPVIAYGVGGSSETIIPGVTGTFIEAQTWEDIADAIIRFDPYAYDPIAIRAHAERYSKERFKERMKLFVAEQLARR